ncbi:MAG: 4-(cytidine 5'-diphospho)-2-C-methyl-D-erythritol kinase [Pseudanabaenaceae cyanobacterium bins.68]|nr:4-(cytidine 5'-diphospho)-2-C-methyl-D-erythritol kinase [Pseudanabaenaceae cyanobacterium bins.68]
MTGYSHRDQVTLLAPAKINLYLEIKANRADGYHELVMVLQSINLSDRLEIHRWGVDAIKVHCNHPQVPCDQTNLAYRAAALLQERYPDHGGVEIRIEKNIPVGAGLAGGSADGAAVLVGLNHLWQLGLTLTELQEIAAELGSDLPFCLGGGTALAVGRGEVLSSLPGLENLALVIAKPKDLAISTGWVYQTFRQRNLLVNAPQVQLSSQMIAAIASPELDLTRIGRHLYNDLERVVLPEYAMVRALKAALQAEETYGVLMSGSGSTVFAIARDLGQAQQIAADLPQSLNFPVDAWAVTTCSHGIQMAQ